MAPTYEYECANASCGCVTEKVCKFTERFDAPACEQCGSATHQIISSTSFVLKGSGWAQDGYSAAPAKGKKKK